MAASGGLRLTTLTQELLVGTPEETLSIAAMRVSNPDCSALAITNHSRRVQSRRYHNRAIFPA
jgi:hypothetical protein